MILEEAIAALAIQNDVTEAHICTVLLANELHAVRPIVVDDSPLTLFDDEAIKNILATKLSPLTVRKDTIDEATLYFCDNRILCFQIPSLISWIKSCKLKLAVPASWTQWMKEDYPTVES